MLGVHTVCGSKGNDVRLGTSGAREHKPIQIKGLLMVQNQRGVSAPCLPEVKVRSSRCLVGFDSRRTASHSAQGETQGRGTAWAGVCRQAMEKVGAPILLSMEERGRVQRGLEKNPRILTMHEIKYRAREGLGLFNGRRKPLKIKTVLLFPILIHCAKTHGKQQYQA